MIDAERTRVLRYVELRLLEERLGSPSEEHSHFKTAARDGRPTEVSARYWACGCRALLIDPQKTPFRPCALHEGLTL